MMQPRLHLARWMCSIATALALACSPGEETTPPAPLDPPASVETGPDSAAGSEAAGQFDSPPADLKSTEKVRCLVDSPPGCNGCDRGDTCVYEELTSYDCVYVVYGTDCTK